MNGLRLTSGIIFGIGTVMTLAAIVWWYGFYADAAGQLNALADEDFPGAIRLDPTADLGAFTFFSCLFGEGRLCQALFNAWQIELGEPYHPALLWIGVWLIIAAGLLTFALSDRANGVLAAVAHGIDTMNQWIGRGVAWLAVVMVLLQFTLVVMRYVFGLGSIFLQEGMEYLHATLFMVAAGYTLHVGAHVRVDILYSGFKPVGRATADTVGVLFLLMPVTLIILSGSLPYVLESWRIWEGSTETSGIQAVFLLKSVILVFVGLMFLQGVSLMFKSILIRKGLMDRIPEHGAAH